MDNGQWTMDNGQWIIDNGQWTMDNEKYWLKNIILMQGRFAKKCFCCSA